jgi:lipoprotein-anchoring transpeptidase ErfK/SrfK
MRPKLSRRDFLKLGGMSLFGLAFGRYAPDFTSFDDSNIVRIATEEVLVRSIEPSDKSLSNFKWNRDDLVHVYNQVAGEVVDNNPIWYRVWGGYIHSGRVQPVRTILQKPLDSITEGTRILAEVTVPFTMPSRYTKVYSWQKLDEIYSRNPPLYYESVHWIDAVQEGPDGKPWYRIFDELEGGAVKYFVPAMHMRPVPPSSFEPISPDVPKEQKKIEVNLTTQTLTAYEYGKIVFQTNISSGIPGGGASGEKGLSTTTPDGKFEIIDKYPSKHMGYSYFSSTTGGGSLADSDGYVLPGVPWTSFFTEVGHAFHGTYWHQNFGAPMSHGCVNMRTREANWIFRWALPPHTISDISNHSMSGTPVEIHY